MIENAGDFDRQQGLDDLLASWGFYVQCMMHGERCCHQRDILLTAVVAMQHWPLSCWREWSAMLDKDIFLFRGG